MQHWVFAYFCWEQEKHWRQLSSIFVENTVCTICQAIDTVICGRNLRCFCADKKLRLSDRTKFERPSFTVFEIFPKLSTCCRSYMTTPPLECFLMCRHIKGSENAAPPQKKRHSESSSPSQFGAESQCCTLKSSPFKNRKSKL